MNYGIVPFLLTGSLFSSVCLGSMCTTIADGSFTATSVWDCGCDPVTCDTLDIRHALDFETDLLISNPYLHVATTGSLTGSGSGQLVITGNTFNDGVISGDYVRFFDHGMMINTGSIVAGVLITVKDSTLNHGTMSGVDSLVVGVTRRMRNYGQVNADHFFSLGYYENYGSTTVNSMVNDYGTYTNFGNTSANSVFTYVAFWSEAGGTVDVSGKMISGIVFDNLGTISADSLIIQSGGFMYGSITCTSALIYEAASDPIQIYFGFGGSVVTRDLLVNEDVTINGPGTICISGHSENHGRFSNLLDVCDLSRTTFEPPFLDVNTGTYHPSVSFCENPLCTSVGVTENHWTQDLLVYPQPIVGPYTVELPPSLKGTITLEISDLWGRTSQLGKFTGTDRLQLERNNEAGGMQILIVRGPNGEVIHRQSVLFAP